MAIVSPLIDRAWSDARNTAAAAISCAPIGAPHRDHAEEDLAHRGIFQFLPRQRCLHHAWRDADNADPAAAELQRAAARQHVDAGLRRTVGRLPFARLASVHRRDVDDDAGASLLEHLPGAVLHAVEDAAERDGLDGFPLLVGQLGQRRNGAEARVVHHDVQRPERLARRAHRSFDLALVRHVGDAADRAIPELAGGGIERVGVAIAEQYARAGFDECGGNRLADPGGGAGHDRPFAFQKIHVQLLRNAGRGRSVRLLGSRT